MLIGQKGVKYGLTVPKPKAKPAAPPPKKSVFGDDDSDEDAQANVEQQIARQAARKQTDKKASSVRRQGCAQLLGWQLHSLVHQQHQHQQQPSHAVDPTAFEMAAVVFTLTY